MQPSAILATAQVGSTISTCPALRENFTPLCHIGFPATCRTRLAGTNTDVTVLPPTHVACIMDGNRRWAARQSVPDNAGHRAGQAAALDVIDAARSVGVRWLTLYAFSSENWHRPPGEVAFLMRLVQHTVRRHALALHAQGIRRRLLGAGDPPIPQALR